MTAMLELSAVSKRFDSVDGQSSAPVLDEVDLVVAAGQTVAVTGPSGSGKSTLLNIIGALDRPTAGQVLLEGVDHGSLSDRELADLRSRRLGFVFQAHHLLPQCTALENVLVPTLAARDAALRRAGAETARRLLGRVGLGDHMHHRPSQLSGGQRQRVALVRALINRPALLLADEPTGSLDREAADGLADLLLELNCEEHTTLILATHADWLAARMRRLLVLGNARLHEAGAHA